MPLQLGLLLGYLFYSFIWFSGTSATNPQLKLSVRGNCRIEKPEFPVQSSFGIACSSNRKLMMRSLSFRERGRFPGLLTPCPKVGYHGGERLILETAAVCTLEPLSLHVASGGFSQEEKRQIPSFQPAAAAVPSIQVLQYKRSQSMPHVLNDVVIEIEGGSQKLIFSHPCPDFSQFFSRIHADQSSYFSAFMTQDSLEQKSMGPAPSTRSHHGVVPDAAQVTANCGWHQGESSIHFHDQTSDKDSPIVSNITPPDEGGRTSHSLGSPEVELVPNPSPLESLPPRGEDEPLVHNPSRLTETSLGITAQAALAILTIRFSGNTSLSDDAKILLRSAVFLNIIGFLCCVIGILVGGKKYGGLIAAVGYIATVYGFVAIMGMQLDDHLKLWITIAAWIALFPVLLVFALCRQIESWVYDY